MLNFKVDDLNKWKYTVDFLSADIIFVNIGARFDEVKKIMNIIWNSLEKLKALGLPKNIENYLGSNG